MCDAENTPAQSTATSMLDDAHVMAAYVMAACGLTGSAHVECSTADEATELTKALMSIGIVDVVDPANITISVTSTGVTTTLDMVLLELVATLEPELASLRVLFSQSEDHA